MNHSTARQIKWDIIDHLLSDFAETANSVYGDYTDEQREYAKDVIKRIAVQLNVKNHIYL